MANGFAPKQSRPTPKIISCAEASALIERLQDAFCEIEDLRVERTRVHVLSDILMMAILAVIAGALMLGRHRELCALAAGLVSRVFSLAERHSSVVMVMR